MKSSIKLLWGVWACALFVSEALATPAARYPIDIPPDASSLDYQSQLRRTQHLSDQDGEMDSAKAAVREALHLGERNLAWLSHLNRFRGDRAPLSFSSKESAKGVPIHAPKRYSPATIERDLNEVKATALPDFLAILRSNQPLPNVIPFDEAVYLGLGRQLDRVYQTASRWTLIKPYLWQYAQRQRDDIRGFYFLERETDLVGKLHTYASLPTKKQSELREFLEGLCFNGPESRAACRTRFDRSIAQDSIWTFYADSRPAGQRRFSELYDLNVSRPDLRWKGATAELSFLDPGTEELRHFLKHNIEAEWSWPTAAPTTAWNLLIDFGGSAWSSPYLRFAAGATPNVDGLGGNRITMDANAPLSEYEVQWTIRHEFGHVLGFPDCYVEFYDEGAAEMVNYQIDTTDLMCSRTGKMNERLYTQLREIYD